MTQQPHQPMHPARLPQSAHATSGPPAAGLAPVVPPAPGVTIAAIIVVALAAGLALLVTALVALLSLGTGGLTGAEPPPGREVHVLVLVGAAALQTLCTALIGFGWARYGLVVAVVLWGVVGMLFGNPLLQFGWPITLIAAIMLLVPPSHGWYAARARRRRTQRSSVHRVQ